jgi:replication-associated recombination protein RarA
MRCFGVCPLPLTQPRIYHNVGTANGAKALAAAISTIAEATTSLEAIKGLVSHVKDAATKTGCNMPLHGERGALKAMGTDGTLG